MIKGRKKTCKIVHIFNGNIQRGERARKWGEEWVNGCCWLDTNVVKMCFIFFKDTYIAKHFHPAFVLLLLLLFIPCDKLLCSVAVVADDGCKMNDKVMQEWSNFLPFTLFRIFLPLLLASSTSGNEYLKCVLCYVLSFQKKKTTTAVLLEFIVAAKERKLFGCDKVSGCLALFFIADFVEWKSVGRKTIFRLNIHSYWFEKKFFHYFIIPTSLFLAFNKIHFSFSFEWISL